MFKWDFQFVLIASCPYHCPAYHVLLIIEESLILSPLYPPFRYLHIKAPGSSMLHIQH